MMRTTFLNASGAQVHSSLQCLGVMLFSPNGARYGSPGQRPGILPTNKHPALKGRNKRALPPYNAPSGLGIFTHLKPQGDALGYRIWPRWGFPS
jgi:hypothetical protein